MPEQSKAKPAPAPSPAPAPPEIAFTPDAALVERVATEATPPHCPACGRPLTRYSGANPHKAGSYECAACRRRYHPADLA